MEHRKCGYIRVSSKDQNEGRQLEAMRKMGITERDIYLDKQSEKNFERANYQLLKTGYSQRRYFVYPLA